MPRLHLLKLDVVFYGDSVPKPVVADVFAATEAADALLVVGSSLMVFSSFRFQKGAQTSSYAQLMQSKCLNARGVAAF